MCGRVVIEDAVGEMPNTTPIPAKGQKLTADSFDKPERLDTTVSAQDAARAAALARVAASTPSPGGLAKKRRVVAPVQPIVLWSLEIFDSQLQYVDDNNLLDGHLF